MGIESVQVVVSRLVQVDAIPPDFVHDSGEHQPRVTGTTKVEVPVIDLSDHRDSLVLAVAEAAAEWGIFQVVNHGVPREVVDEFQRVGREFFDLPQEEKERYAMDPESRRYEGYGTDRLNAKAGDKKEWNDYIFHKLYPAACVDYGIWPKNPPAYRKANTELAECMSKVAGDLLGLLSLGAGLEEPELKQALGGEEMELFLKVNCYPPCPRPDLAVGLKPHKDIPAMTVMVPDEVPGLQVFRDGRWIDASYSPHSLVVLIGDQMDIMTNGKYGSVLHRAVVNRHETRMSWPVFCQPPAEMVFGTLPQFVSDENPDKFKPMKFKDYQHCKVAGISGFSREI